MTDTDTDTATPALDWTAGGTKPERSGPRCQNPECGQVLMLQTPGRKYCARCDLEAGRDVYASTASPAAEQQERA